jgi:hypothetical protein
VALALVATFRSLGVWMKKVVGMRIEQGGLCIKWLMQKLRVGSGVENKPSIRVLHSYLSYSL